MHKIGSRNGQSVDIIGLIEQLTPIHELLGVWVFFSGPSKVLLGTVDIAQRDNLNSRTGRYATQIAFALSAGSNAS
jgi:hypothetical protein